MPSEPGNRRAVGPIPPGMDPSLDPGSLEPSMSPWLAEVRAWLDARARCSQPADPSIALGRYQCTVVLTMADPRWQPSPGERFGRSGTRARDQEPDVETLVVEDTAKESP